LRAFLLTVAVVDDVVALVVIATVYSHTLHWIPLLVAVGVYAVVVGVRHFHVRTGLVYAALGTAAWVALQKAGVEPVVIGLAIGLLAFAYPAPRTNLER